MIKTQYSWLNNEHNRILQLHRVNQGGSYQIDSAVQGLLYTTGAQKLNRIEFKYPGSSRAGIGMLPARSFIQWRNIWHIYQ